MRRIVSVCKPKMSLWRVRKGGVLIPMRKHALGLEAGGWRLQVEKEVC